jgi:hypothetical protein
LGTLQFLQAVEQLGQKLYHYGARPQQNSFLLGGGATVPIFRLPVPHNPNPKKIKYKDSRKILRRLINDLAEADGTLEQVTDSSVKLPLHFGLIRLDLDGDGHATEKEKLWRVYARLMNRRANVGSTREAAQTFTITFDKADVHWLRGYCHLISAIAETALAHDWSELFERSGHILFANVDSPYETISDRGDFIGRILDEVALIHLVQFPVRQPKRMQAALNHFKIVIDQSRLTWQEIKNEVDNDREWIPGPHQTGVVPGVRVTPEMVTTWHEFVDEAEEILAGDKLIPFWRGENKEIGVNLNRVFTESREFDLVLWMQGSAAVPYLEKGKVSTPATWARFQRTFRGEFIGFVVWFN